MSTFAQQILRAVKLNDVLELLKSYEAEFNKPDLHDRVLIFDVVASRPRRLSVANAEENERNENGASNQNKDGSDSETKDGSDGETAKTENVEDVEIGVNTNDESETESDDCEIASNYVNGSQQIENKLSNESQDDDDWSIKVEEANDTEVTNKHETVLNEDVETNQNTSNGNKMKGQQKSEITNDDNDATPSLNDKLDKEQSENSNEISSKSNEAINYPTNEGQTIRQHKFYIHGTWLAIQSSYFRSLFFSGTKESSAQEVHVQISESEEQAHLMLLEAMYKIDMLDNVHVDELLEVLRLSHKYDAKFVFKKCKNCLEAAVVSIEIFEKIMCFIAVDSTITDVKDLVKNLLHYLVKEFSPLDKTWQTTRFENLSETTLKYLLSSDKLVANSENTIFHALMHWIEQRGIDNVLQSQELPSLLSLIRFELMSIDYLHNIVQHNSVAKKLPDFNDHFIRGISYHALPDTLIQRLPRQPVKRKASMQFILSTEASKQFFIPYTWVIAVEVLDKLAQTGQTIKSCEFWYCGYKMVLVISHVLKFTGGNKASFNATLSLAVINLTEQSEVMIQWQPASQSFRSTPPERKYTFEKKACVSCVDITYETEVHQEESNSNEASRPIAMSKSSRFTFNTPSTNTLGASESTTFSFVNVASSNTNTLGASKPTSFSLFSVASPSGNTFGASTPSCSLFGFAAAPRTTSSGPFGGGVAPRTTSLGPFGGVVAPRTTSSGLFSGVAAATTTSSFGSVASSNTNMLGASKPASVSKKESPIPCLSIDVKMKLV
ncbi:BTB POZ domain-containing POB1 [Paramuricea clavata]|uniref:BTB POZ domain-containing POB1 n=1 Tax=Paramuricea clavata TaxID=317549 RepID=A0A6S7JE65_PARCT|nr:BTB POZ domain-containing POB1 [Paramuricea clavata]